MLYAGKECTREQVQGTIQLLKYYRAFLESDCERCRHPERSRDWTLTGETLTKPEATRRLFWLTDVAINRKAGIPDAVGRKQDFDYVRACYQDQRDLQAITTQRLRVYQF